MIAVRAAGRAVAGVDMIVSMRVAMMIAMMVAMIVALWLLSGYA